MIQSVKVVIPLYRERLPDLEAKLLRHNLKVLSNQEIVLLMPEGLNVDTMRGQFDIDKYEIVRVSTEWLGRKNGVSGYNRMMLSEEFYAKFDDVDYILICQTDVYIFRDELTYWVARGYDYIGAPWGKKPKYDGFLMSLYLDARIHFHRKKKGFMKQDLFGRVGNGGLSLRRIDHFREACIKYSEKIEIMCASQHYLNNEDVFWALVPREFVYPSYYEALNFSIDTNPEMGLQRINGHLPFGCHGLTQPPIYAFWRDKITL